MSGEEPRAFFRRRMREARQLQSRVGSWSERWAKQLLKWHSHSQRDPNQAWTRKLLTVRTPGELGERRSLFSRPQTRAMPGFTNARWAESLTVAESYLSK